MKAPQIKNKSVFAQLDRDSFDPLAAAGGVRGIVETAGPGLVFVVVYTASSALLPSLATAAALCVFLILARILTRQDLTYSVSGLLGVAVGIGWALFSGHGRDFFTLGLISAAGYAALIGASIALRYPVVSVALTPLWSLPWKWWRQPQYRTLARTCRQLSWLWFTLFAVRLAVQLPLWWWDQVSWLGAAKLALGIPLFLLVAWLTWLMLSGYQQALTAPQAPGNEDSQT